MDGTLRCSRSHHRGPPSFPQVRSLPIVHALGAAQSSAAAIGTPWSGEAYLLPPKKPFASRRICERMNGSGSAPITMAPGCPHGVQQTILAFGVLRGMTVMLGVG